MVQLSILFPVPESGGGTFESVYRAYPRRHPTTMAMRHARAQPDGVSGGYHALLKSSAWSTAVPWSEALTAFP